MEALNQGAKTFVKEFKPELWERLKNGTLVHENPVLLGLFHSIEYEHLLDFLDCKFLVNLVYTIQMSTILVMDALIVVLQSLLKIYIN